VPSLKEILESKNVVIPENFEVFKDIFRHFRGKQVQEVRGDARPLLEKPEEFYLQPSVSGGFLQGDVLDNIPPVWLAKAEDGTIKAFTAASEMAMVLSNECDCEHRTENSQAYIRLCRVMPETTLFSENAVPKEVANLRGNLRANKYTEYFWMPAPKKGEQPIVADVGHIYSVGLEDLYEKVTDGSVKRKYSLSEDAYFLLLIKLAWFFLRPPAPDTARRGLKKWS